VSDPKGGERDGTLPPKWLALLPEETRLASRSLSAVSSIAVRDLGQFSKTENMVDEIGCVKIR